MIDNSLRLLVDTKQIRYMCALCNLLCMSVCERVLACVCVCMYVRVCMCACNAVHGSDEPLCPGLEQEALIES
jgi:hypothetical protein